MKYSVVIPVYNRPGEVDELLESLSRQTFRDFETIVVEDGSSVTCKDVVERYAGAMDVHYYEKPNSGPGPSRNYGVERSRGEYVLILDSDVVLPEGYLDAVDKELAAHPCDAFGGPDRAHASFSVTQKAINYAMTSFFTTGGIRGGKQKLDKFYPRSFNMGMRRDVYNALGGFSNMRFGEDVDLSMRLVEARRVSRLFESAWVWHKRRTDFRKFFRQVHNSGIARINLSKRHPGSMKLVHLLPACFTVGMALLGLLLLVGVVLTAVALLLQCAANDASSCAQASALLSVGLWTAGLSLCMPLLYSLLIFVDSSRQNRSVQVGLRSIAASFVQFLGYGSGFIRAWWRRCVCGKGEFEAFKKNFYK